MVKVVKMTKVITTDDRIGGDDGDEGKNGGDDSDYSIGDDTK